MGNALPQAGIVPCHRLLPLATGNATSPLSARPHRSLWYNGSNAISHAIGYAEFNMQWVR
jgi:hypothetical protein